LTHDFPNHLPQSAGSGETTLTLRASRFRTPARFRTAICGIGFIENLRRARLKFGRRKDESPPEKLKAASDMNADGLQCDNGLDVN